MLWTNQFISLSYIFSNARRFSGTKIIISCETVVFVRQLTQRTNVKTRVQQGRSQTTRLAQRVKSRYQPIHSGAKQNVTRTYVFCFMVSELRPGRDDL